MLTILVLCVFITFGVARALWQCGDQGHHDDGCGCEICLAIERERPEAAPAIEEDGR